MARPLPRANVGLPFYLAVTLFYLLLVPEQANFRVAGVLLSPYRVLLIGAFVYLARQIIRGNFRLVWTDALIAAACGWIWLASYITGSVSEAVVQGGAHTLDIGLAYFMARYGVRTPQDFRAFLIFIAPAVGLMGGIIFIESIVGQHLLQPPLARLTGNTYKLGEEFRLGLMRGAGSFPHPILAGISLASFVTLFLMAGIRGWPKLVGTFGAGAGFFSLSSAALLGLGAGAGSLVYDYLVQRIANLSWRLLLAGLGVVFVLIELTSNSGFFSLLVRYASLNTVSAYNRVLIWRYGSETVQNHPLFGIGYDDWERPAWMQWETSFSVDNFWLLQAMRFGVPLAVFLGFAVLIAVVALARRSMDQSPADARLMRGVAISLAVFALGAVSVALWLNALVWFFMLTGMAVSLGVAPQQQPRSLAPRPGLRHPAYLQPRR